jgi:hypothetical protein
MSSLTSLSWRDPALSETLYCCENVLTPDTPRPYHYPSRDRSHALAMHSNIGPVRRERSHGAAAPLTEHGWRRARLTSATAVRARRANAVATPRRTAPCGRESVRLASSRAIRSAPSPWISGRFILFGPVRWRAPRGSHGLRNHPVRRRSSDRGGRRRRRRHVPDAVAKT